MPLCIVSAAISLSLSLYLFVVAVHDEAVDASAGGVAAAQDVGGGGERVLTKARVLLCLWL